jgi:hypothetical protein
LRWSVELSELAAQFVSAVISCCSTRTQFA